MRRKRALAAAVIVLVAASVLAGCTPRNSPSRYGVNGIPGAETKMREAGFKWVRIWAHWAALQPSGPSLDPGAVAQLRSEIQAYTGQGFSVTVTFARTCSGSPQRCEGAPPWAKDWSQAQPCTGDRNGGARRPLAVVNGISPFREFAYQMAVAFKDVVAAWEMWNEPELDCRFPGSPGDFRELIFKPGYDGIKAANTGALILGPAVARTDPLDDYYTYVKNSRRYLVAPVNAINVHRYGSVADITSTMNGAHNYSRCTEAGYCVSDYWLTEFGFEGSGTTAGNNAVDVFKHCDAQADCKRAIYYSSSFDGANGETYGLLDNSNVPRDKYWPVKTYLLSKEPALPPPPQPCASPAAGSSTLFQGQCLYVGQSLRSPNGQYVLAMQTDGNLVIYGPAGATWHTGTYGRAASFLTLQTDGNLVIYGPPGATWSSGTTQVPSNALVMEDDGDITLWFLRFLIWSRGTNAVG